MDAMETEAALVSAAIRNSPPRPAARFFERRHLERALSSLRAMLED